MKQLKKYLVISLLSLIGCAASSWSPQTYSCQLVSPVNASGLTYENETFKITFKPIETHDYYRRLHFIVTNKGKDIIKVYWEESVYIDLSKNSHRIVHKGIPYENRDKAQQPSIIAPESQLEEIVIPADHIYYNSNSQVWLVKSLFSGFSQEQIANGTVQLLLTIGNDQGKESYVFKFQFGSTRAPSGSN